MLSQVAVSKRFSSVGRQPNPVQCIHPGQRYEVICIITRKLALSVKLTIRVPDVSLARQTDPCVVRTFQVSGTNVQQ